MAEHTGGRVQPAYSLAQLVAGCTRPTIGPTLRKEFQ